MSGVPEATIRRIFSGDTPDPRFDTIARLTTAMGGSLDEILNGKKNEEKKEEKPFDVISSLIAAYETRIAEIKEYIVSLKRDKKVLAISTGVLVTFIVCLLVVDISFRDFGWIQY